MRRERLKDQIEHPRVSLFDSFVRTLVVVVSVGAVYYALSGRGYPPRPHTTTTATSGERLVLTVTKDHSFYWNREGPFALEVFQPRLAGWLTTTHEPKVVITADESALLADAIHLLTDARHQGVTDVRLEAHPRADP
jgi:biopolymer transport protein ExbD